MLVTMERIQAAADRIAAEFCPDEIILFGSYAYGTPNEDSDVDLLVIMPTDGKIPETIGAVFRVARDGFAGDSDGFPLDIVVYDPDALQQRILWGDFFVRDIVGKGKSLFRPKGNAMNAVTEEWIENAEEDWNTLSLILRTRVKPSYKSACFHAQQCAEKYLKAVLQEENIRFPKTHDLEELLALALPAQNGFASLQKHIAPLNPYAVLVRYPGFTATKDEARAAKSHASAVRNTVRAALGLEK